MTLGLLLQQLDGSTRQRARVPERHQSAPAIVEQFLSIPVGRRNDRLARAHRVGQRARHRLLCDEVGSHIKVGGSEETAQLVDVHKPVVKYDMVGDSGIAGQALKPEPVLLPLLTLHIRVRYSEHQIHRVRESPNNFGQRVDHELDALVRR